MHAALFAAFGHYFFGWVGFLVALFLILLVLVQRGRGGGLAGAFGGMGGQSAFGTKAGDTFTRITVVVAALWILTCMASIKLVNKSVRADDAPETPTIESRGGAGAPGDAEEDEDAAPATDGEMQPDATDQPEDVKQPIGPSPN